jgi:PAS domain S-box-containing protein
MRQSRNRACILIVDDRVENLVALEAILEPLGHEIVRAGSGKEALREILRREFALVLLDVQMPGMNGFETAQLIKARERSRHLPIIFLTAISKDEEYVFEGYSSGAGDYLSKPFNPAILRSKVAVFVELFLKNETIRRQGERLRESERRELELEHRAKLQESEARYSDIVGSAMEAIITFGEDRRITLFNAAAERTFGYEAAEALEQRVDTLFSPPLDDAAVERLTRAGSQNGVRPELTALRRDGEAFPVELAVSRLELPNGHVFTMIAHDITERRRAEEALRHQAESLAATSEELRALNDELSRRQEELETAMASRSRFYASMSHELRTPINAILGYTSLMLENVYGPLNEQQLFGLERAKKAAEHLLELVNDVLDLSKIEAGKMDVVLEDVAFPDLIRELFVTVQPLADQDGTPLTLEEESPPFTVQTDPRRIRQILLNLLSNALKFGRSEAVTVICRQAVDGGAEIDVVDCGQGIPEDAQEAIFEEFVQLHDKQGTGLGLPISRSLAHLLGGDLEIVQSEIGTGSTFRLSLPGPRPRRATGKDQDAMQRRAEAAGQGAHLAH